MIFDVLSANTVLIMGITLFIVGNLIIYKCCNPDLCRTGIDTMTFSSVSMIFWIPGILCIMGWCQRNVPMATLPAMLLTLVPVMTTLQTCKNPDSKTKDEDPTESEDSDEEDTYGLKTSKVLKNAERLAVNAYSGSPIDETGFLNADKNS